VDHEEEANEIGEHRDTEESKLNPSRNRLGCVTPEHKRRNDSNYKDEDCTPENPKGSTPNLEPGLVGF